MRALLLTALLAATPAACGEARNAAEVAAPASTPAVLMGRFNAASDSARSQTGDVEVERGGLMFSKGVVLYTRVLNPRHGYDLIARDGDSYAATIVGPSDLNVELRRVTGQTIPSGSQGVCGGDVPAYVALAYEPRATSVTMLVFAGDEPPGPEATRSRICGAFAYSAPSGARTREGIVLQ